MWDRLSSRAVGVPSSVARASPRPQHRFERPGQGQPDAGPLAQGRTGTPHGRVVRPAQPAADHAPVAAVPDAPVAAEPERPTPRRQASRTGTSSAERTSREGRGAAPGRATPLDRPDVAASPSVAPVAAVASAMTSAAVARPSGDPPAEHGRDPGPASTPGRPRGTVASVPATPVPRAPTASPASVGSADETPVVRIHIGRVDVRASLQAQPPRTDAGRSDLAPPEPLGLREYLDGGGARR